MPTRVVPGIVEILTAKYCKVQPVCVFDLHISEESRAGRPEIIGIYITFVTILYSSSVIWKIRVF